MGVVLVTAHDFKDAVRVVWHGIKANKLMCHGYGGQLFCHFFPVVDRLVVGICPVEVEVGVKLAIYAGVGKIQDPQISAPAKTAR